MPFFFPFGGQAKSNCEVRDHHKIIRATQFRPDPGSDDLIQVLMIGVGDRGMIHDQFRAAYGIPAKRGCAVIPCGNDKCGCA